MFARHKYRDDMTLDDFKDPVGSIKYDGGHYYVKFDNEGRPSFISRRQSVKGHYPDRSSSLPHLSQIQLPEYRNNIYSTELIHSGWDKGARESHSTVSGILNSLPPKAHSTQKAIGPIRAVLLDVIHPKLDTYGEKINHLKELEERAGKPDILFTPNLKIGHSDILDLIQTTRNEGREGVIVTSLTTPETNNPRLKIKHLQTYNLKVIGMEQEEDIHGNPKESMGALKLADATGRYVGKVGTGFTREDRIEMWKNRNNKARTVIGELKQVKAMSPQASALRSAVYNGDADGDLDTV